MRRSRFVRLAAAVALFAGMAGCIRRCPPPELFKAGALVDLSTPPDAHAPISPGLLREVAADFRQKGAARNMVADRPYNFLALSGGGLFGSFGVGILNGWTASGTRPEFDVVTGISTGALISTFAFLGPEYDGFLRDTVEDTGKRQILRRLPVVAIPLIDAVYTARPLDRTLRESITPEVLCKVAKAHAAGRRLYIGTTSLDTRRLVIWDMGAIAARNTPESADLYRKIVLASSSVPGAFPAVKIPVEVDGERFDEMHVDGGTSDGVIFRGFMVGDRNKSLGVPGSWAPPGSRLYVVINGKLYFDPDCVRRRLTKVLSTAASTILYGKTRDELYRIFINCMETGVDFRLTATPQDLDVTTDALNTSKENRLRLYDAGYKIGVQGMDAPAPAWRDLPPGSDTTEQALPRAGTRFRRASPQPASERPGPRVTNDGPAPVEQLPAVPTAP